jgi:hypothetical protein
VTPAQQEAVLRKAREGYRVAIVIAGEDGYRLTGNWPYHGKQGEVRPWFWGPTLRDAERIAREQNRRHGLDELTVDFIIGRSMARGCGRGRP